MSSFVQDDTILVVFNPTSPCAATGSRSPARKTKKDGDNDNNNYRRQSETMWHGRREIYSLLIIEQPAEENHHHADGGENNVENLHTALYNKLLNLFVKFFANTKKQPY